MKSHARITLAALAAALLSSLGLNLLLLLLWRADDRRLQALRLDPLGLSAFPSPIPPAQPPVIVFYGDSRAAAWEAPAIPGATVLNRGISGQTTAQILGRFEAHIAPLEPQIIVIQAGVNDLKDIPLFPEQQESIIQSCKDNLREIVQRSVDSGARVILTTIFPLGELPLTRRLLWSNTVTAAIAEVNAYLLTLASPQVTILESGALLTDPCDGRVKPQYSLDGLHLNPAGYAELNRTLSGLLNVALDPHNATGEKHEFQPPAP